MRYGSTLSARLVNLEGHISAHSLATWSSPLCAYRVTKSGRPYHQDLVDTIRRHPSPPQSWTHLQITLSLITTSSSLTRRLPLPTSMSQTYEALLSL